MFPCCVELMRHRCLETLLHGVVENTHITWPWMIEVFGMFHLLDRCQDCHFDTPVICAGASNQWITVWILLLQCPTITGPEINTSPFALFLFLAQTTKFKVKSAVEVLLPFCFSLCFTITLTPLWLSWLPFLVKLSQQKPKHLIHDKNLNLQAAPGPAQYLISYIDNK